MTAVTSLQAASALSVLTSAAAVQSAATASADTAATPASQPNQIEVGTTTSQAATIGHAALVSTLQAQENASPASATQNGPAGSGGDRRWTTDQLNAMLDASYSMPSADISKDLYSGQGVPQGGTSFTFADIVKNYQEMIPCLQANGNTSMAQLLQSELSGAQAAFANHTLTFENASKVPELNYTTTFKFLGQGDKPPTGATFDTGGTFNWNAVDNNPDGKNHAAILLGTNLGIYMTW